MGTQFDRIQAARKKLYEAVGELETEFPSRRFTLDGHLVGSLGEVVAEVLFDISLLAASAKDHDARASDGRDVQIKLTAGDRVAMYGDSAYLIVMRWEREWKLPEVIYNGPGSAITHACGKRGRNGQRQISITKLRAINSTIREDDRIKLRSTSAAPRPSPC